MWLRRIQLQIVGLWVGVATGIALFGCVVSKTPSAGVPIDGAISYVRRSDGSRRTYIGIHIGEEFDGKLPEAIDSITVTGPHGPLPITKEDFTFFPQWRGFWTAVPGAPALGTYSFQATSGIRTGRATDTQSLNQPLPMPDVSTFSPAHGAVLACLPPGFSWNAPQTDTPLYFQVQIKDLENTRVYGSDYVPDMDSVRLPPDVLDPGQSYLWRVRVADGAEWIGLNNRSQSRWQRFSVDRDLGACGYAYTVPVRTDDGWATSSLEQEGVDAGPINRMMAALFEGVYKDTHSILLIKSGKLVLEEYFSGHGRGSRHVMASATKSVSSILIGVAVDRGLIPNVDMELQEVFREYPETRWVQGNYPVTLEHVLTMTAGLDWKAATSEVPLSDPRNDDAGLYRSSEPIRYTLDKKMIEPPGTRFNYSTGLSTLLGEVVRKASGMPVAQFAEEYLFRPLKITDARWKRYPDGTVDTGGGLFLRPRDMAKMGQLVLNRGKWDGREIVSDAWVRVSTTAHVAQRGRLMMSDYYGYQWHVGLRNVNQQMVTGISAQGLGGQYIIVLPTLDAVMVLTSKHPYSSGWLNGQAMLAKYVIPALAGKALPGRNHPVDPTVLQRYIGEYRCRDLNMTSAVIRRGDNLYLRIDGGEPLRLFPESERVFHLFSEAFGDVQVTFPARVKKNATHGIVHVGFLSLWCDRVK
jgi:CubicO group peptidase (beta-lactamase class C family)